MEKSMAGMTVDSPPAWNSANCAKNEIIASSPIYDEHFYISSEDLFSQIERDNEAYLKSEPHPWAYENASFKFEREMGQLLSKALNIDRSCEEGLVGHNFDLEWFDLHSDPTYPLPDAFSIMVNPATGTRVPDPFIHGKFSEALFQVESKKPLKPYHPHQDHDYVSIKDEVKAECVDNGDIFNDDEPHVEVWEIEDFLEKDTSLSVPKDTSLSVPKDTSLSPVPEQLSVCRPTFKKETRRSSARTAEIRLREQARVLTNAVAHAVLKTGKIRNTRQFKNIKPKNSVETTPSQSDIEECYYSPVKQTQTRTTKKKSCKGRIDHSESERHRREVLRENFSLLCRLIPSEYLRGDKVSSQISKQKILNGAKSYIAAMHSAKSSYKSLHHQNNIMREKLLKTQAKLLKFTKRQK